MRCVLCSFGIEMKSLSAVLLALSMLTFHTLFLGLNCELSSHLDGSSFGNPAGPALYCPKLPVPMITEVPINDSLSWGCSVNETDWSTNFNKAINI